LNLLGELTGRKIAVLGDMLELGQYERQGHELVGVRAAEVCSELITIGEKGKIIAEAARKGGLSSKRIFVFEDTPQVIEFLQSHLKEGDIVLIKGSHGLRMDRIVSALEAGS
jgi:UDP-N-acetylmuramoyl-tripeptide--D-alanyl-D-alanine ligase